MVPIIFAVSSYRPALRNYCAPDKSGVHALCDESFGVSLSLNTFQPVGILVLEPVIATMAMSIDATYPAVPVVSTPLLSYIMDAERCKDGR